VPAGADNGQGHGHLDCRFAAVEFEKLTIVLSRTSSGSGADGPHPIVLFQRRLRERVMSARHQQVMTVTVQETPTLERLLGTVGRQ
jgi:hypothetical protein